MSSILLNTQTATLLELLGNGKSYTVPPFQRDYSWDEEQWDDLWTDIIEVRRDSNNRHYMGTVVVAAESDRTSRIIDGQQRLATLSIFALAVVHRLDALTNLKIDAEQNAQRALALRAKFIGDKDPASLVESSKLHLNETDDAFYQDYLVQLRKPPNPRGLPRSRRLLYRCFEWFTQRLETLTGVAEDGNALAQLLSEVAARRLYFIVINVDDDLNAYTVFETLNARGIELSSTDLLKNYLFSLVSKSDLDWLRRRWNHIVGLVRQERLPDLVRYQLMPGHGQVRAARVFKTLRDQITTAEQTKNFIEQLEPRAELFAALDDPAHEYWQDKPGCRVHVRELKLLGVKQMMPVLFATWEKLPNAFESVLRDLVVLTLRHTIIGRRNPNELERPYREAAIAVNDGNARSAADVFEPLRSIYPNDDTFERDFQLLEIDTGGQRKRLVKYILSKLEADARGKFVDFETDNGTIEHILPENPTAAWDEEFPQERQAALTFRVGNLTLLEASTNRNLGNADFAAKREGYAKSQYELTKRIAENGPAEWSPQAIEDRATELAKRARHIWRAGSAT